jgi:acyl-CoA synthetase (AMP-forming)/AMP-acid ligase II
LVNAVDIYQFVEEWSMSILTKQCSTFVEILRFHSEDQPDSIAFTYLDFSDAQESQTSISYSQLDLKARSIAAMLQTYNLVGQRVLLIYPPGIEFIAAFFGCMYAGVVAVPVYPPTSRKPLDYLEVIVGSCQPSAMLMSKAVESSAGEKLKQSSSLDSLVWIKTDDGSDLAQYWNEFNPTGDVLSHIQYTSGSTGTPKGVMLSQRNIVHNSEMLRQGLGHTSSLRMVSWLPLYHDMGLIANVLHPVYMGGTVTFMSPLCFIQKPIRWLQAISNFQGTTSGGPNFAYELCIRKIKPEQIKDLSLHSWQVAYSGAETVRAETLDKFGELFEPCGFRRDTFYPCYGMAETTLIITGSDRLTQPLANPCIKQVASESLSTGYVRSARPGESISSVVSCGKAIAGQQVLIVNPDSRLQCVSDEVGEIWVSGPSVGRGYWNLPQLTEEMFTARLSNSSEESFLRTGDLGFICEGELYITGRLKDLIIIRGRNHYPQDIEWTVEHSHSSIQKGGGAAFSVEVDGEEQLVLVQEIERSSVRSLDIDETVKIISGAVAQHHDLNPHLIVLIKPGSLPRTSSGKVRRSHCRTQLLEGSLSRVA